MPESTPVKETAGQVEYERHALESGIPFCSFRPQYIYGEKSNKWDYIDVSVHDYVHRAKT